MKLETTRSVTFSVYVNEYRCHRCGRVAVGRVGLSVGDGLVTLVDQVGPPDWRRVALNDGSKVFVDLCPVCDERADRLWDAFMNGGDPGGDLGRACSYVERLIRDPCCKVGETVLANALIELNKVAAVGR